MNAPRTLILSLFLLALTARLPAAPAPEPQPEEARYAAKLIAAIAHDDYDAFVADGFPTFRHITKDRFQAVCDELSSRLEAGYSLTFLGDVRRGGARATLWRIRFADDGDDKIVTLTVVDHWVGAFTVR